MRFDWLTLKSFLQKISQLNQCYLRKSSYLNSENFWNFFSEFFGNNFFFRKLQKQSAKKLETIFALFLFLYVNLNFKMAPVDCV